MSADTDAVLDALRALARGDIMVPVAPALVAFGRLATAVAQRDMLAEALAEIESFPVSGYHAGAAQRIAHDVLAVVGRPAVEQP